MVTIGKITWSPDYGQTDEDKEFRRKVREVFEEISSEKSKRIPREPMCLIDFFYEQHPDKAGQPVWLSCSCPKHSVKI